MKNFNEYINDIKEQLSCNASEEYKENYTTYVYSSEDIDNNLDYFMLCFIHNVSGYKALLFFDEYLINNFK